MVVLDVSDMTRPRQAGLAQWQGGGSTHTCLPLPGRGLVVATDEQVRDGPHAPRRAIHVLDVSGASPAMLAECPHPDGFDHLPLRLGAHNLHREIQAGSYCSERLVFASYFSAGVRCAIRPTRPPGRGGGTGYRSRPPASRRLQINDLLVDSAALWSG